jgi:transcriptional regulator with XRE-family HTH domain
MPSKPRPNQAGPTSTEPSGSPGLGQHLRRIRRDVYQENLRDFAKRIHLSPAYISKIELAQTTPRRTTLEDVAAHLGIPADELLIHAGYLPADAPQAEVTRLLIDTLSPGQQDLLAALARVLRDYDVTPREAHSTSPTANRKTRSGINPRTGKTQPAGSAKRSKATVPTTRVPVPRDGG